MSWWIVVCANSVAGQLFGQFSIDGALRKWAQSRQSRLLFGQTTFLIDCEKAAEDFLARQYTVEGEGGKYGPEIPYQTNGCKRYYAGNFESTLELQAYTRALGQGLQLKGRQPTRLFLNRVSSALLNCVRTVHTHGRATVFWKVEASRVNRGSCVFYKKRGVSSRCPCVTVVLLTVLSVVPYRYIREAEDIEKSFLSTCFCPLYHSGRLSLQEENT